MKLAADILGPEGRIPARPDNNGYRPQQLEMADAVSRAIRVNPHFEIVHTTGT
mgnify:CR=1 FL=1